MKFYLLILKILIIFAILLCTVSCDNISYPAESGTRATDNSTEHSVPNNTSVDEYSVKTSKKYYTVSYKPLGLYKYKIEFFDDNGELVKEFETRMEPHIVESQYEGSSILGFWTQAGTGISTRYAVFYNPNTKTISDNFYYYLDNFGSLVACGMRDGVSVTDIFSPEKYSKNIVKFSKPIDSNSANSINAEFVNNGEKILITYRTIDGESMTESFNIK